MLTQAQNQALYPVLQHYTGAQISSISSEEEILYFTTPIGEVGKVIEGDNGDWNIIIGGEIVEYIEKQVFDTLVKPNDKSTIEDYLYQLNSLILKSNLKYRSKTLVSEIIKFLEDYILTSDFAPKKPISIGAFVIFTYKGKKMVSCLN